MLWIRKQDWDAGREHREKQFNELLKHTDFINKFKKYTNGLRNK